MRGAGIPSFLTFRSSLWTRGTDPTDEMGVTTHPPRPPKLTMPQLTESAAEKLGPEQATALARVLDLQARWENHRDDPAKTATSIADLQARQKAFEAFRAALEGWLAEHIPEIAALDAAAEPLAPDVRARLRTSLAALARTVEAPATGEGRAP